MRLEKITKEINREEPKYYVQEIAQAIGMSEGTIHGYFKNSGRKASTKDGLTIEEIVQVIERKRTRGEGIDWEAVKEIQRRLFEEYDYKVVYDEEEK